MTTNFDANEKKGFRLLAIYERLLKGGEINKIALADEFGVSPKSIQRDIDELRAYISEKDFYDMDSFIEYDRAKNCYRLVKAEREWFSPDEILAISKILLESRAFSKDEAEKLVHKLLSQVSPDMAPKIKEFIKSDVFSYVGPLHGKDIIRHVWQLTEYITDCRQITFTYTKQDLTVSQRTVNPVAIMFSEYYFYLAAIDCNSEYKYPKNFRIDRIENIAPTGQKFSIPYSRQFKEGEYKNRIQFMYPGKLFTVRFKFNGDSLESALDRLPTAKIIEKNKDWAIVEAEIYSEGVKRWMLSQKDGLEVLSPQWFREEIKADIQKMASKY